MIGLVATLAAFGIIALIMFVGWRTKLPPPDPNWGDHAGQGWRMTGHLLLPSSIPPPHWYSTLWFARYLLLPLVAAAAALHADALERSIVIVLIALTIGLLIFRIVHVLSEV